jgi:hypothetical protein
MNAADMMHNLINRAKHLQEFVVTTPVPEDFRFNGLVPFDMEIKEGEIFAKVWGIDFNEAVARFDEWLDTCR